MLQIYSSPPLLGKTGQLLWLQCDRTYKCPGTYTKYSNVFHIYSLCPALVSYIVPVLKHDTDIIFQLHTIRVCQSNVVSVRAQNSWVLPRHFRDPARGGRLLEQRMLFSTDGFKLPISKKREKNSGSCRAVEDRHHCNLLDLACHSLRTPASLPNAVLKRFHITTGLVN